MMEHAWDGYVKYAWGSDALKPVSLNGTDLAKVTFNSVHSGADIILDQSLNCSDLISGTWLLDYKSLKEY